MSCIYKTRTRPRFSLCVDTLTCSHVLPHFVWLLSDAFHSVYIKQSWSACSVSTHQADRSWETIQCRHHRFTRISFSLQCLQSLFNLYNLYSIYNLQNVYNLFTKHLQCLKCLQSLQCLHECQCFWRHHKFTMDIFFDHLYDLYNVFFRSSSCISVQIL